MYFKKSSKGSNRAKAYFAIGFCVLALTVLCISGCGGGTIGSDGGNTTRIAGKVANLNGTPIPNATISVFESGASGGTDVNGSFSFQSSELADTATFLVEKDAQEARSQPEQIPSDTASLQVNIVVDLNAGVAEVKEREVQIRPTPTPKPTRTPTPTPSPMAPPSSNPPEPAISPTPTIRPGVCEGYSADGIYTSSISIARYNSSAGFPTIRSIQSTQPACLSTRFSRDPQASYILTARPQLPPNLSSVTLVVLTDEGQFPVTISNIPVNAQLYSLYLTFVSTLSGFEMRWVSYSIQMVGPALDISIRSCSLIPLPDGTNYDCAN